MAEGRNCTSLSYAVQPERFTDLASEAFQTRRLHARIVAQDQKIIGLEAHVAWLERDVKALVAQAKGDELAHLRQYELPAEARWHREPLTGEDVPDTDSEPEMDDESVAEESVS